MRKFSFSTALAAALVGSLIAGDLRADDSAPVLPPVSGAESPANGRVPVRLRAVNGAGFEPAARASVTFARDGATVLRTDAIAGGTVQASDLSQGVYSVFVQGDDGFATFPAIVAPVVADQTVTPLISVGLIPSSDEPTARRLINQGRSVQTSPRQGGAIPASDTADAAGPSVIHGTPFEMGADGSVRGRVVRLNRNDLTSQPISDAQVYFVRQNAVVAESVSGEDGLFVTNGLSTGIYSLVVTRGSSHMAIAVEVTPASTARAAAESDNEFSLAAFQADPGVPEVPLIYEEDGVIVEEYVVEEDDPLAGGMFAGGPGGGGAGGGGAAGGGGGFGLGALLGGAGLAAGIVALADDDDDIRVIISPASP